MARRKSNLTLIFGIVFIGIAAVAAAITIIAAQPAKVTFVVPSADVPSYREITVDQLTEIKVDEDPALEGFLTADEVNALTADGSKKLYSVGPLASGSLIPDRSVVADPAKGLAIVSADETLVGVTTTLPGSLIGTIKAGSVVDAIVDSSTTGGRAVTFAKVVAIGDEKAAEGLAGVGSPANPSQDEAEAGGQAQDIQVVLSVARADADSIAGQEVAMTLYPFCEITEEGAIVPTSEERADACQVPAERQAAGQ